MNAQSDDLLRKLYARLQDVKAENERLKKGLNDEPIAIVGIGCRLPGGAKTLGEFGRRLASGFDFATQLPDERPFFPSPAEPHWRGSMVDEVEQFDAAFFDLSAAEAAEIDPQQRLLLEVTYHALEDARYPANQLRGRDVGVFIGTSSDDYQSQSMGSDGQGKVGVLNVLGAGRSLAAGRIAYHFDFTGPVAQIDTACSSSLMAIHLACSSLRQREASVALAGGVALNLGPEGYLVRDMIRKLSRTGRCRPFAADADGFARGEGCGLVVLKRLSDALDDKDHIHAVIYASAVNHNGRSNGMGAPNGEAQRRLMRETLDRAGLRAGDVDFVEPHGTGSVLGDSIEVHAIGDVLVGKRESPLWLGSMKSRLGHLEAAAAVTSIIRTCAMLAAETLLPDMPIDRLNSMIDWEKYAVRPLAEAVRWPRKVGYPRRAAINAFGVSGTNVSLILGDPPEVYHRAWSYTAPLPALLCVSGKTKGAYLSNLRACHEDIRTNERLEAVALGSCLHKEHFGYRRSFVVGDRDALIGAMAAAEHAPVDASGPEPLAFCFDGGAWSMATLKELYASVASFKSEVDACLSVCAERAVDLTWLETLQADGYRQALSLIGEYAMAKTWLALGVRPALLACRGRGLLVAACVAGMIGPAQMCGLEPFGDGPAVDTARIARPNLPVLVAATDGFSSLDESVATDIASLTTASYAWPAEAILPVKRMLWLGSGNGGLLSADAAPSGGVQLDDNGPGAQGFIGTVRRLYDLGFDLDFERLYAVPRAGIDTPPPGYQFDTSALWTARQRIENRVGDVIGK